MVDEEWFEGADTRRIPRCHWGCENELLMAGCIMAHSILLGGSGFPCIHPAIFCMMTSGDMRVNLSDLQTDELPLAEDIPRDASTIDLLEMISKVCTCTCSMCLVYSRHMEWGLTSLSHSLLVNRKLIMELSGVSHVNIAVK